MTQRAITRAAAKLPFFAPDSRYARTILRVVLTAVLVAGAYFLSARLAFIFAFPKTRTLLLWPPSTVLLLAMLFTPRRTWWTFILAALPAHLLAVAPPPATLSIAALFYAGNVIESFIIALLMQRYNGGIPRFNHFNSTLIFVAVAVFIAPAIGTAVIAAVAALAGVQPGFAGIWQARFLSIVVSMLMLVPPAVVVLDTRGQVLRNAPQQRYAEAGLLGLGYIFIFVFMLASNPPELRSLPVLLFVPLPLLLWAGVRLGVSGVSLGLLCMALMSLSAAHFGRGPFSLDATADNALGLKLFLIELGVPLVLMAALLAERKEAIHLLHERNRRVQQLAGQLINAQEEERRRVARELHDQVGQSLTMVKISLNIMQQVNQNGGNDALLNESVNLIDQTQAQVRDLSVLLHPTLLDDLGLEPALRSLLNSQGRRSGIGTSFHVTGLEAQLPREIELICYRVAQEGLNNVAKHARATHVGLELTKQNGQLCMILRDDGTGFDVDAMRARASAGKSMGIISMTERATLSGGTLQIISAPGRGTTLILTVPLAPLD